MAQRTRIYLGTTVLKRTQPVLGRDLVYFSEDIGELYAQDENLQFQINNVITTITTVGYNLIQDEGVPLVQRTTLNFVGAGVTATDAGGKTIVTIPGGIASAYQTVQDEGVPLVQRSIMNFVGAGVTAADVAGVTVVTIPSATTSPAGANTEVQYNNGGVFGADAGFTRTAVKVTIAGNGTAALGSLYVTRGDAVNQYILMHENVASPNSAFLTFKGSAGSAIAMGATFAAGVPTAYIFTDAGGVPLNSIDAVTGANTIANLSGVGTRTVVASATGVLSTISTVVNTTIVNDPNWTLLGQLVYGSGASTGAILAGNINADNRFLRQTGTGAVSAAPQWVRFDATDILAGTLAVDRGGTGIASYAVGDLIYASGATTLSKLADVATNQVLLSGGVGVAPAWGLLTLASAQFVNQGTTTTVLHGNAAGNPSWGAIVNADITNGTIDLTTKVTGVLPIANGGTAAATAAAARTSLLTQSILTFGSTANNLYTASVNRYFGGITTTAGATGVNDQYRVLPYARVLTGAIISVRVAGTLGSAQNSTVSLMYGAAGASAVTLSTTVAMSAAWQSYAVTGLSTALAASDQLSIRVATGAFTTAPTTVTVLVDLILE